MHKTLVTLFAALLCLQNITAQVPVKTTSHVLFQWNNYSGEYAQNPGDSIPYIVTYVANNHMYKLPAPPCCDYAWLHNATFSRAATKYQAQLPGNFHWVTTYDSSPVFFFIPYIRPADVPKFEYRVLLNDEAVIRTWQPVDTFTVDPAVLDGFKKPFAASKGYKAAWDNFITFELRRKDADTLLSVASVYWRQVKPVLLNIYTANELNEFLTTLKNNNDSHASSYTGSAADTIADKWKTHYKLSELDTITHLPKKLILSPTDNNVIFYLDADITNRLGLEYQLEKDGDIIKRWQPNDFDNNFIWLNNLSPGSYVLHMRFSGQRQNVTDYPFEIKPAWHQTTAFKIIAGTLIGVFFSFIIVLFALSRQRNKTAMEQVNKAKLSFELKAIYAQLNPHFIFNALTSIQGLVNNNNIAGANRYISTFGSLMRDSLAGGEKELISLDKEITMLNSYLLLEQLRFGFTFNINVDDAINATTTDVPPLLLQPLVENAVKHGVAGLQQAGIINVQFNKQGADMAVTITDNGSGFIVTNGNNGYGLKLSTERIKLLNGLLKGQSITFTTGSNNPTGTAVHLLFKNWWQ